MAKLQEGSHGEEVRRAQQALVDAGYYIQRVDGIYGSKTGTAVSYFQLVNGLPINGDIDTAEKELLGITDTPGGVEMTLPAPDAVGGQHYVVTLTSPTARTVRVVCWFRAGATEVHAEDTVQLPAAQADTATITIPEAIRTHEGEVHVSAVCYPETGNEELDRKVSQFWINR